MRISLRLRLILSQILPILIILPLFGFYLTTTLRAYYIDHLRAEMLQTGELVTDAFQTNAALANDPNGMQKLLHRVDQQTAMRIQIIDQNGIILASTEPTDAGLAGTISQENSVKSALAGKISYATNKSDVATVAVPVTSAGHIGAVRLSLQLADVETTFNHLNWIVGMGIFIVALVGLGISYFLGSTLSNSLRQLTYEAKSVAKGDYTRHVNAKGDIEVADLANYFNEMVDKLAEQRNERQEMLSNIAHELRQPISAIRTAIEVILDALTDIPEPIQNLQNAILAETDRLNRFTGRLDFAAREIQPTPDLSKREPIEIIETVNQIVLLFAPKAQQLGINLVSELPETLLPIKTDKDALDEILTNLVDNALKFTPRGGQVNISAGATQDHVWIRVSDTGMGLTMEEQKNLFRRFYRGDPKRSRPHGIGLGLAITHELVKAHGGNILVSSETDRGTTFLVELPL